MKKILTILLALMIMLAMMTACGNEADPEEPAVPANADAEEPAETPEDDPAETEDEPDEPEEIGEVIIETSDATPLMWRVTAPDGQTMYLFGSIHAAESSLYPLSNTIMDAFYDADYLAVEVDIFNIASDMGAMMAFAAMLEYDDGMSAVDEIGEDLYTRALAALENTGFGLTAEQWGEQLDGYIPYAWIDTFTSIAIEFSGLSAFQGLDLFFLVEAMEHGIKVLEVETLIGQLEALLSLSPEYQTAWLEEALDIELGVEGLLEMYEAYKYGAIEYFEYLRDVLPETYNGLGVEFYQDLLINRDIVMADAVEQYFEEGKNVFYVVGLLHMVGENGIIDLLTQRGYIVELVEIN